MRDPPSIAPLSWCLPRALISHGLSRPTFQDFLHQPGQRCPAVPRLYGQAARPCPGCSGPEAALPLPFPLPHVLPPTSGVWRLRGFPVADAVRGRLGAAGIPVAPHLPIGKRQRPKEASALAARPRVLQWEGMVLARWEEHGPPVFPSSLTARLSFVWRSCSLSLCVTGALGSRPTQAAPGR